MARALLVPVDAATARILVERRRPNGLALGRFIVIYATPPCVITPRSPVQGLCAVLEHLRLTRSYVPKARTLRRRPRLFVVEARVVLIYVALAVPPSLVSVAAVLAVIRAKKEDLPEIVRALMRMGPCDGKRDDDGVKTPPSLPKR